MKYLFIHYKFLVDVKDSFTNYILHLNKFNEDQGDDQKNYNFIRERNRKLRNRLKDLFKKYGYFDIIKYKLNQEIYMGYLVWLELSNKELFNNIIYDDPYNIYLLLKNKKEYYIDIVKYKKESIKRMLNDDILYSDCSTVNELDRIKALEDLTQPLRNMLKLEETI